MSLFEYLSQIGFWQTLGSQLLLTALTFALAAAVGFPMGVLAFRYHMLTPPLIGMVNLLQTLPAFALFGIFVVLGRTSSATSLLLAVLYTILPVIFGTEKGFRRIGRPPVDAALGMGMDRRQLFFRVMLPLASPQVMVGLRKAAVVAVGMVTLATMRGGGLGVLILDGIQQGSGRMVVAGAAPACLMALAADLGMALAHRRLVPAPLRRRQKRERYIAK